MRLQGARQRRGNAKSLTSYDHIRRQNGYRNGQEPEAPVIACHGMSGGHGPACVLAEQSADWYGKYGWVCFQFQCKQPFFIQRGSIFLIKSELFTRYSPSKGRHGNYFQFNHCRLRRSWRPLSECSRCMQLEIKCGSERQFTSAFVRAECRSPMVPARSQNGFNRLTQVRDWKDARIITDGDSD